MRVHLAHVREVTLVAAIILLVDGERGVCQPCHGVVVVRKISVRCLVVDGGTRCQSLVCSDVTIGTVVGMGVAATNLYGEGWCGLEGRGT